MNEKVATVFLRYPTDEFMLLVQANGVAIQLSLVEASELLDKAIIRRPIETAPKWSRVFLSGANSIDQICYWCEQYQTWRYARNPPHNIPVDFAPQFWRPAFVADSPPTSYPPAA